MLETATGSTAAINVRNIGHSH